MAVTTVDTHSPKSDMLISIFLVMTIITLLFWTITKVEVSPLAVCAFLYKYVGFTSAALVPMAIFITASYVLWLVDELHEKTTWGTILKRIQSLSQAVAFLGTAVGIGCALQGLTADNLAGDGFSSMALQYGNALWSTAFGIVLWIAAHILVKDAIIKKEEKTTSQDSCETTTNLPEEGGFLREKRFCAVITKQQAAIKVLQKQVTNLSA